jgi:hypothetical protein
MHTLDVCATCTRHVRVLHPIRVPIPHESHSEVNYSFGAPIDYVCMLIVCYERHIEVHYAVTAKLFRQWKHQIRLQLIASHPGRIRA